MRYLTQIGDGISVSFSISSSLFRSIKEGAIVDPFHLFLRSAPKHFLHLFGISHTFPRGVAQNGHQSVSVALAFGDSMQAFVTLKAQFFKVNSSAKKV